MGTKQQKAYKVYREARDQADKVYQEAIATADKVRDD